MNSKHFSALRIEERIHLFRNLRAPLPQTSVDCGQLLVERWKASPAFMRPGVFEIWLSDFGLTESELASVLGMEAEDVSGSFAWMPAIDQMDGRIEGWLKDQFKLPSSHSYDTATAEALWLSNFKLPCPYEGQPVLSRILLESASLFRDAGLEFFSRLKSDHDSLTETFGRLGRLIEVDSGQGDSHAQGRTVCLLKFESGKRLVYKPRSLAVDEHLSETLDHLNPKLKHPLRIFKTLNRKDYGWCEFIEHSECATDQELEAFYWRQGAWLALFYFLSGRDFHAENVIASGAHPIPIDVEMIFCPRTEVQMHGSENLMEQNILESCLSTGLLPAPRKSQNRVYDGSGLGIGGTGTQHLPKQTIEASAYTEQIEEGFRSMYGIFLKSNPTWILDLFENDQVRLILRPTATYAGLLEDSYHPELLQDGRERELYFTQLWWDAPARSDIRLAVSEERRQLLKGDIPYFSTNANARAISRRADQETIHLAKSGLEIATARLAQASSQDLERQLWTIRASMALLERGPSLSYKAKASPKLTAIDIGEWLMRTSLKNQWATVDFARNPHNDDSYHEIRPMDFELYNGVGGVAFYLNALARETGREDFDRLAQLLYQTLAQNVESATAVGAFSGAGGFLYLSAHMQKTVTEKQFDPMRKLISRDRIKDVIGGSAGAIHALLALYESSVASSTESNFPTSNATSNATSNDTSIAISLASQAADHLLAQVNPETHLISNLSMPRGLSHGHTGIAYALARLSRHRPELLATARKLIDAEDRLIAEKWTDLENNQVSWCHGSVGLAMGRLKMLEFDSSLAESCERALSGLNDPWPSNQSLCHGEFGNLETLELAAKFDSSKWRGIFEDRQKRIWQNAQAEGLKTAMPKGVATPGLMTGLTGIGYALLRMENPSLPSILTLDAPVRK